MCNHRGQPHGPSGKPAQLSRKQMVLEGTHGYSQMEAAKAAIEEAAELNVKLEQAQASRVCARVCMRVSVWVCARVCACVRV